MWTDVTLRIDDQSAQLSVECLEHDARERSAATLAWMLVQSTSPERQHPEIRDALHRHLSEHITWQVPDERLSSLGPTWWGKALQQALIQFVRMNALAPAIQYHIHRMRLISWQDNSESAVR